MSERLRESVHTFVGQCLGRISVDKFVTIQRNVVVDRYNYNRDGLAYVALARPQDITEIPYRKIGPFNTPFLDHDAARTRPVEPDEEDRLFEVGIPG